MVILLCALKRRSGALKREESVGMVVAFDRRCEIGECHATINLEWHICTCCGAKWFKHWRQSHFNSSTGVSQGKFY